MNPDRCVVTVNYRYARDKSEDDAAAVVNQLFGDFVVTVVDNAGGARPGLDLKTRTLVCVVSDAATGREPELRIHLRMALNQGWTETELTEVLIHMSGYVGVPIIREAMICARDVFAEVRAER